MISFSRLGFDHLPASPRIVTVALGGLVLAALLISPVRAAGPPAEKSPPTKKTVANEQPPAKLPAAKTAPAVAPAKSTVAAVPAELDTYVKPDGSGYFALILPAQTDLPRVEGHDVVVLFDTSASQVGEARERGLKALRTFLSLCQTPDRVYLAAVDLNLTPLTDTFAEPGSSELTSAIDRLTRRVPLGATDMPLALEKAAAVFSSDSPNAKAVVYFGDGVSGAQIFVPANFAKLTDQFVEAELPVFSYGIGPRIDGQMLAALSNYTGGTIVLDADDIDPKEAGIFLAAGAHGPIVWPSAATWPKAFEEIYPHRLTPLRGDRATVVVGTGVLKEPVEIAAQGKVDGREWSGRWSAAPRPSSDDFSYFPMLIAMAKKDDGTTLPILGEKGLAQIGHMFLTSAAELIELAQQALKIDNFDDAEQMADEALRRDPNDPAALALRREIAKRRSEQIAAAKLKPVATPAGKSPAAASNTPATKQSPAKQSPAKKVPAKSGQDKAGQGKASVGKASPGKTAPAKPAATPAKATEKTTDDGK